MNMEEDSFRPELSEKDHAEQERLISSFEQGICPSCNREVGIQEQRRGDGFCDEGCYQKYTKENPFGEANLTQARGEYNHRNKIDHSG